MRRKTTLTTGEVAAHCEVTPATVWNWVKRGQLPASTTPGGHCRVHLGDLQAFLRRHGMLPYPDRRPSPRRVLVVEDDPAVLSAIASLFRKIGDYQVATASDGFQAGIQVLAFRPDLVILDLFMPQMDGFKVCRRIKSSTDTAAVKILVLTGALEPQVLHQAAEAGADRVMTKPFQIVELQREVEALLGFDSGMAKAG